MYMKEGNILFPLLSLAAACVNSFWNQRVVSISNSTLFCLTTSLTQKKMKNIKQFYDTNEEHLVCILYASF